MKNIIVIAIVYYLTSTVAYCFDDNRTHLLLTERAISISLLSSYLVNNLGFSKSIDKQLTTYLFPTSRSILEWLQQGSTDEDSPVCRASTHFHDPLKPWKDSYVTDSPAVIKFWCNDVPPVWPQYSNITWATGYESKGVKLTTPMDRQDMNWDNAQRYFYSALTETDPLKRDDFFIKTFRAVGQVMHLLQDMAVPAHVRNDFQSHLAFNGIEGNNPVKPLSWFGNPFEHYVKMQPGVISNTTPVTPTFASPRLTDFWDTDGNMTNPGLAEFANGNFFSDETINENGTTPEHTYPYPRIDASVSPKNAIFATGTKALYECVGMLEVKGSAVPKKYPRKYLSQKECPASGGEVDHFVALSFMNNNASTTLYELDDNVHYTYSQQLIPRAVGYSSTLLDHFFRGKLTIASITPDDITFHTAKVTVTNATVGEAMGIGDISLVIRYKALSETSLGGGKYLLNDPSADYSYKVATLKNVNLVTPQSLTFDFGSAPLPMNFSDMTMQLVFKGKLGNEDGAVAVSKLEPITGIYTDFTLSLPPSGVYAKTSDDSPSATFNELRVTALSDAFGGLTGGTISLALDYRTAIGDQFQSVLLDTEPANAVGYIFKTPEKNGISTLQEGVPVELVFDLSSLQLPVQATNVELNVVYTNADGSHAIGVRDISEPTPVDVYNNTDYTCLNGTWYRYDDPVAMAIVDSNNDGISDKSDIYPHTINNISFLTGPAGAGTLDATTSHTLFAAGPLPTGQKLRMGYILTDYNNRYAFTETRTGQGGDPFSHPTANRNFPGTGFRNDVDGWSSMYNFRRTKMWWGEGVIFINPEYNGTCTSDALNQKLGL